jgi:hypothetical protein
MLCKGATKEPGDQQIANIIAYLGDLQGLKFTRHSGRTLAKEIVEHTTVLLN